MTNNSPGSKAVFFCPCGFERFFISTYCHFIFQHRRSLTDKKFNNYSRESRIITHSTRMSVQIPREIGKFVDSQSLALKKVINFRKIDRKSLNLTYGVYLTY